MFRAFCHYILSVENISISFSGQPLTQTHTKHFPALTKNGFHNSTEELFITSQVGDFIARHSDYSTLHLWRRIKHILIHREEIFHIIPRLSEHAQNAVGLVSWLSRHSQCDLTLYH